MISTHDAIRKFVGFVEAIGFGLPMAVGILGMGAVGAYYSTGVLIAGATIVAIGWAEPTEGRPFVRTACDSLLAMCIYAMGAILILAPESTFLLALDVAVMLAVLIIPHFTSEDSDEEEMAVEVTA